MSETIAITAGTYDPVTVGHLDIIRRASKMYDVLYVGIFDNPEKTPMFSLEKRMAALTEATKNIPNVRVVTDRGMLCDYARKVGARVIVKGVRNEVDRAYEILQADFNMEYGGVPTVLLDSNNEYSTVSSTAVRELVSAGKSPEALLPLGVWEILSK